MSIKSYQSGLCFPILLLVLLLRQSHREGPNTSPSALPLSMFSFQLQTIYKFCSLSCDPHPCFSFLGYFFLVLRSSEPLLQCAGFNCSDLSCCRAQALGVQASGVSAHRLDICGSWALQHRLSSCSTWA